MSAFALGYSQAVRQQTLNLPFPWFESTYPSHMTITGLFVEWTVFYFLDFLYMKRRLVLRLRIYSEKRLSLNVFALYPILEYTLT